MTAQSMSPRYELACKGFNAKKAHYHDKVVLNMQASDMKASITLHQIMAICVVHEMQFCLSTTLQFAGSSEDVHVRRLQIYNYLVMVIMQLIMYV